MNAEELRKKIHEALEEDMATISKSIDDGTPLSNFDAGRSFQCGVVEGLMSKIISEERKKCDTQGES